MGNRDEELILLIKQIRKGHGDKREFCNSIYKEVYGLVYPLYRNKSESVSVSKKILIEICKKLDDIDVNKNVHRQIATITSAYLLEEAVNKHEEELKKKTNLKEYEFSRIKEDDEFLQIMREKAVAFRSAKDFEEADDNIKSLTDIQLAILELYAYEMRSVDEIEDLTDIDSTFVASWIADTKDIVVGGPIISKDILEEASLADLDEEDEDKMSQEEDSDADEESLREEADELDLEDERENRRVAASRSDKVHRGKGKRSNTARIGNFIIHENPATILLKRLFPALTLPMRMIVLWAAGGVVLITLVAVIITSVILGGKSDKSSNKTQTGTQAVTTQSETKQSSTEKSNSTTAASKDDNKATEATTKKTTTNNNNNNNNNTEETSKESENEDESSSENETETSSEDTSSETTAGSEETTTVVSETTTAAQETTTAATATTATTGASSQETTTAASPAIP
ncbi:MAG: hypothetical protein Q4F06_00885 [Eubacteriales bacterium]|nr:hypothetical protein [Eubacteriales bacterium]